MIINNIQQVMHNAIARHSMTDTQPVLEQQPLPLGHPQAMHRA